MRTVTRSRSPGISYYTQPQFGRTSSSPMARQTAAPKIAARTVKMLHGTIELAFSLASTPIPVSLAVSPAPAAHSPTAASPTSPARPPAAASPARPPASPVASSPTHAVAAPVPATAQAPAPASAPAPKIAPPPVLPEPPFPYNSKYRRELQLMDRAGAINLGRFQPPPNQDIARVLLICCMPYEGLPHTLGKGPLNDCIQVATYFRSRAYHVYYMVDVSPLQFVAWFHRFLHWGKDEFVFYFSGHGAQVRDEDGDETDGMDEVLVFYDENKRRDAIVKAQPQRGITDCLPYATRRDVPALQVG